MSTNPQKKTVYRLFVGGLPFSVNSKQLRTHFVKFNNLKKVLVIRCPRTKRSKGYGFIVFNKEISLLKAAEEEFIIEGKVLDCHISETKSMLKTKA